jgi:hypothetical protein
MVLAETEEPRYSGRTRRYTKGTSFLAVTGATVRERRETKTEQMRSRKLNSWRHGPWAGNSGYLKQATILPGVLVGRAPSISPSHMPRPDGKLASLHPVRGVSRQPHACIDHAGRACSWMLCVVRVATPFFPFSLCFLFLLRIALVVVTAIGQRDATGSEMQRATPACPHTYIHII